MADFDTVFRKYHHRLFLYTLKFVDDENEALDIVQNVFVKVWESNKLPDEDSGIHSYLFTAIKNSCLNYLKHQQVVRSFEKRASIEWKRMEAMHYQSGEKSLIEKEDLELIEKAILSLSDIYREPIVLSRFEGLKNKEIAQKLNLPLRTVETRIFRALALLKEKLSSRTFFILMNLFVRANRFA